MNKEDQNGKKCAILKHIQLSSNCFFRIKIFDKKKLDRCSNF